MKYYITQTGREFLEEGRIGDVVKKVGAKLSKVRKSFYRTKGEKAASKAKLKAHMDASDAQSAKSTAEMEGKAKAAASAKAAEAKAKEPYSGPRVPHPDSNIARGSTGRAGMSKSVERESRRRRMGR